MDSVLIHGWNDLKKATDFSRFSPLLIDWRDYLISSDS